MAATNPPMLLGPIGALPSDRYWADCETRDLPEVILSRALRYRERLRRDGRLDLWRRSERTYYGQDATGGMANSTAVTFGGEDQELVMIRVNHFASLIQAILAMAVSKRPAYEPRASNTDAESAKQVTLAKSLLEYYTRVLHLEQKRVDVARTGQLFGEGYTCLRWNPFKGRMQGAQVPGPDGAPVTEPRPEGDLEAHVLTPLEVVHDLDRTTDDIDWCMLAYRENVWDLAARYPQFKDDILSLRGSTTQRWPRSAWSNQPWETQTVEGETDTVTVWWFYHEPCSALPQGRHAQVVGNVVIYDGSLGLEEIPVYCEMPEREVAMARGHSRMFDLLALQEAYDSIVSAVLTNVDAYGIPNIVAPKGCDISPEMLAGTTRLIEYEPNPDAPNAGMPSVLQLLELPAAVPAAAEMVVRLMEQLCGVNSVTRGDPMPQLKSGAALALVQSLAVSFNTALQSAVVRHDERVASGALSLLKRYATSERQIEIVGKQQRGAMLSWSADDLTTIQRVVVEVGSPIADTAAGKVEIATQLLSAKLITSADEFVEVLTSGRLEPLYRGAKAAADLVARENEQLADGKPVRALLTDDHACHVYEHAAVLAEDHVRADPQLSESILQHVREHQKLWLSMGPELGALTKQSVMPPPILPPPGPPGPPPPAPHPGPHAPNHVPPPNPHRAKPLGGEPPQAGPMMPTNPLSGQRAPNPGAT